MVATKLKTRNNIVAMEQNTGYAGTAVTIASAFTIPANTGRVTCYPSAACHWSPNSTPTSAIGHAIEANEPFDIEAKHVGSAKIIGDGGSFTMTIAYLRGAGRADGLGAVTRPY